MLAVLSHCSYCVVIVVAVVIRGGGCTYFLLIIVTVAVIGAEVACGLSFVPPRAHDFFDTRWASVRKVGEGGEGGETKVGRMDQATEVSSRELMMGHN